MIDAATAVLGQPAAVAGAIPSAARSRVLPCGLIANPFYAISVDEGLAVPHEPLISEDTWIEADVGLIEELGAELSCPRCLG